MFGGKDFVFFKGNFDYLLFIFIDNLFYLVEIFMVDE